MQLQPLSIGTSGFSQLRQAGQIYVDKTALIHELCSTTQKIFLVRPRRFGKSLLLSTFKSLFKYGLRDFKGLAIEKLWKKEPPCTVVRLDFSLAKIFSDFDDFKEGFFEMLRRDFRAAGFVYDRAGGGLLEQIKGWMSRLPAGSLVLLIDEYDAPLAACLHDEKLSASVGQLMRRFFLTVNAATDCLRFLFVTGITKLGNTGISEVNGLEDISLEPRYAALPGFDEEELERFFGPHLDQAQKVLNLDRKTLIDALRTHYAGFCFDEQAASRVFCPWSVLKFLDRPYNKFRSYWCESAGHPSVLMNFLKAHKMADPQMFDQPLTLEVAKLRAPLQCGAIPSPVLVAQAGYLGIKAAKSDGVVELGYPNEDVRSYMAALYADELLAGVRRDETGIVRLRNALGKGALEEAVDILNAVFEVLAHPRYPIVDEASCCAFLQVLLFGAAMCPAQIHAAHGRSALEVDAGSRSWLFEIKFARKPKEAASLLLEDGVRRLQEDKHCASFSQDGSLMRACLVFVQQKRAFAQYAAVP